MKAPITPAAALASPGLSVYIDGVLAWKTSRGPNVKLDVTTNGAVAVREPSWMSPQEIEAERVRQENRLRAKDPSA